MRSLTGSVHVPDHQPLRSTTRLCAAKPVSSVGSVAPRADQLLGATREALARGHSPRSDKGDGDPNQDPDPPVPPASD
jgi:hypothetical protein